VVVNGAAAHKASEGDLIIVACYVQVKSKNAASHRPALVYVDGNNAITRIKNDGGTFFPEPQERILCHPDSSS